MITEVGPVEVARDGSAASTRRSSRNEPASVDEMVISLVAKGVTTGEVQAQLAEVYGAEVSRETISRITAPTDGVRSRHARPCPLTANRS